jgi:DNA polymerase III subunit delta'
LKTKTDTIIIDDIHEIINFINKTSIHSKKVVLIRDIERMNINSSNAFLKTLEEPPKNTIFVCTTSNPFKLIPTIASRFQTLSFNLLSKNEINTFIKDNF